MAKRDAAPLILQMPRFKVEPPPPDDARRVVGRAGPLPSPVLVADWFERWTIPVKGLLVPVELYVGPAPAEPPRHLESRTIVLARSCPTPCHLGIRFGKARLEI